MTKSGDAEVVVLGHPRGDKGDDRDLSHRREVAVGGGAVVVVGDGLRGGHHELDAGAAVRGYGGSDKRPDGFVKLRQVFNPTFTNAQRLKNREA